MSEDKKQGTPWATAGEQAVTELIARIATQIERQKWIERVGQLEVQLAGCLLAAEGATEDENTAREGDYAWSLAYQKVLELRRAHDELLAKQGHVTYFGGGSLIMGNAATIEAILDGAAQQKQVAVLEERLANKDKEIAALEESVRLRDISIDASASMVVRLKKDLDWYKEGLERARDRLVEAKRDSSKTQAKGVAPSIIDALSVLKHTLKQSLGPSYMVNITLAWSGAMDEIVTVYVLVQGSDGSSYDTSRSINMRLNDLGTQDRLDQLTTSLFTEITSRVRREKAT